MRWDVQVVTPKPVADSPNAASSPFSLQTLLLPLWVLSFSQPFSLLFHCSGAEIFPPVLAELVGAGQEQRLQGKPSYFGSSDEAWRVGRSLLKKKLEVFLVFFLLGPQQSPGVNHSNMLMCN